MFNTRRMLQDKWRDASTVTRFLKSYGYEVSRPAVNQWFMRDAVPAQWGFLLLALHEVETGAPASLVAYLE